MPEMQFFLFYWFWTDTDAGTSCLLLYVIQLSPHFQLFQITIKKKKTQVRTR